MTTEGDNEQRTLMSQPPLVEVSTFFNLDLVDAVAVLPSGAFSLVLAVSLTFLEAL